VAWIDALSREQYKELICRSLLYCKNEKGMTLHAWVIINNHIHLVIRGSETNTVSGIMRDFKKYTSKQIIKAIQENP
jgi:REP element-mobilizing transposase RayT